MTFEKIKRLNSLLINKPMYADRYKNRPNMVFDNVIHPDQEFELHRDAHGLHEYPVKYVLYFLS